jgi:drug/metabolite transporter (DMT)-like permease
VALLSRRRREILAVFRPVRAWRFSLTGTLLGSCLALLFWIGGMKYTKAGTAAILNQTSTLYILVFASLFLKEPFTPRKALAAALSLGGILLVITG